MNDQPEALRLADRLEGRWALHPEMQEAAAELRRLHAVEADFHMAYRMKCDAETKRLHAERDALLKALKWLDRWLGHKPMTECTAKIKAAIDAAMREGKT